MNCHRCTGLLVQTWLNELNGDFAPALKAWRCVCCGHIEDQVMRERRITQALVKEVMEA